MINKRSIFMQRRINLFILLVMVLGILAACGTPTTTTPSGSAGASPSGGASPSTSAAASPSGSASGSASASPSSSASASASASASGSGGSTAGSTLAKSSSTYEGTLQYWVLGYQPGGAGLGSQLMDAAVAKFEEANPNIQVEITGYPGTQEGFTRLTQAVQGGGAVDVFRLPSDILPLLVAEDLVAPIDEYLTDADREEIFPNLLEAVQVDGQAYAWPLWVPPVGLYLNLDVFEERGVTPPTGQITYEQFVELAKQLTFTRDDGTQVFGYTALVDPGVVNSWPFILSDGALPLSEDNTQYTWNTPEGISGLQKLVDLAQVHKVTPPDFGTQTIEEIQGGFKDSKIYAMYSEPSGASSGYASSGLNFDVIPMPTGATGEPVTAGGIGLISVAATDDEQKLQASMDLARYLTSAQVEEDVPGFYLAPGARRTVTAKSPIDKFAPFVENTYITPIITEWPQIRTILHPNIQNAILGQITSEEAFNAPAEEINGILSE
jgi:multiple sugar transport system substrate-binding protein